MERSGTILWLNGMEKGTAPDAIILTISPEEIDAIKRVFHGYVAVNSHVSEELCEIIVGYLAGEEE